MVADAYSELIHLYLGSNNITELVVHNAPDLQILNASGNELVTLDLDERTHPSKVFLSANELTQLPWLPPTVEILWIGGNGIENLEGLPGSLRVLDVSGNRVQSDSFVNDLPSLTSLVISGNFLTSASNIAAHPILGTSRGIDCSGIPVGCTEYHYMDLADNFFSNDDCQDLNKILEKAPNPTFPNFGQDLSELCANQLDTLWIPHLTRPDGGFDTDLNFVNQSDIEIEAQVQYLTETGAVLKSEVIIVPAESSFSIRPETLASHASLAVVSGLDVSVTYRGNQQGAAAFVTTTSRFGHEFWVQTGDWPQVFDGLALINLGDMPATVSVDVFATDLIPVSTGLELGVVDPFAKLLSVLSEHLPLAPSIVVVRSSQPSVVQFLRGTSPDVSPRYLFANEPFRVN